MWLNNELVLMRHNLKDIYRNRRIGRIPYVLGILGVFLTKYIAAALLYILSVEFTVPLGFLAIGLIVNYILFFISSLGLLVYRLNDIEKNTIFILLTLILYYGIELYFVINQGVGSSSNFFEFARHYSVDSKFWPIVVFLFWGLPPSIDQDNRYGLSNGRTLFNNCIISYDQNNGVIEKKSFIDDLCGAIWNVLFSRVLDIRGRATRKELVLGIVGARLFISILINLASGIIFLLSTLNVPMYLPQWSFAIFYIWPLITILSVIVRRLHDCLLSGLWIIGLAIPYVNVFVIYNLIFKGSWYIQASSNDNS